MTERRSAVDLGSDVEASLSAFPFAERDWESDARAVEARLSEAVRGSSNDPLLAPPLPAEPGEPTGLAATSTPLTHSGVRTQSLAEMARRSVEQKQASERALLRESLALAAQSRPTLEASASGATARAVESSDSVRPSALAAATAIAPASAEAPRALTASGSTRASATKTRPDWSKLGLPLGALALAAAALLWLRRPTAEPLVVAAPAPSSAAAANPERAVAAPAPHAGEPGTETMPAGPSGIDPNALARESPAEPVGAKHAKGAPTASPVAASAASAARAAPAPEKVVLEDEQAASAAPGEKAGEKPLPPDPALRPADGVTGAIPTKPSTGAVQAALGAVMSGARHCVAGDETASSAVVVFASDGHVQSVAVHGPAAGKPSGACIESQLTRARVQPFAAASFSINATIRPD